MPDTQDQQSQPRTAFARGADTTELRGECPRSVVNVLDAVSMARDMTRTALVNQILGAFAEKVLHESILVQRLAGGNPSVSETSGDRG